MAAGKRTRVEGCEGLWMRQRAHDVVYELKLGGISQMIEGAKTLPQAKAVWKQRTLASEQTGEQAIPVPMTIDAVAHEFFDAFAVKVKAGLRSERTLDTYQRSWSLYLHPELTGQYVHKIHSDDIADYIGERRDDGAAEWTINAEITVLRNVLKRARKRKPKAMFHDPFADLDEDELPRQKPRETWVKLALRPEQLDRLFVEATQEEDFAEAIRTLAFCGFRRNEACGLLWSCVDLVDGVIRLDKQLAPPVAGQPPRRVKLKNDKPREVILLPRIQNTLIAKLAIEQSKGFGQDSDFVFTKTANPGVPIDPEMLSKVVKRSATRAKLGLVGPQVLRRSTASILASAGVQREVGARMLGHSPEVWDANYVCLFHDQAEREELRQRMHDFGFGAAEEVAA